MPTPFSPIAPGEQVITYLMRRGLLGESFSATEYEIAIQMLQEETQMRQHRPVAEPEIEHNPTAFFPLEPMTIAGGGGGNIYMSTQDMEKEKPAKKIDKATEKRLIAARDRLSSEEQARIQSRPQTQTGDKEREYINLIRNKKQRSRTAYEVITSEFPVAQHQISGGTWNEILKLGYIQRHTVVNKETGRTDYRCAECNLEVPHGFIYVCNGSVYCAEHAPNLRLCALCNHLTANYAQVTTFDSRDIMVCRDCVSSRRDCKRCGNRLNPAYMEHRFCERCVNVSYDGNAPNRHFSFGLKWVGKEKGKIYKSNRMFSCEIEALTPEGNYQEILLSTLPKEMGVGTDGSVGVRGQSPYGFEIQTPRLQGRKGEELIERLTTPLKTIRAKIDETCGMHVHLDGKGIISLDRGEYPLALVQLWKSYVAFEDVILSLLPHSRRRNDYCRPLAEVFSLGELDMLDTIGEAEKLWYKERSMNDVGSAKGHHYHSSRYFGANFHSLFAHGHFEVRFHSGTMKPTKILEWANLHALIMDACAEGKVTNEFIQEYQSASRLSERTTLLFNLIGLSESSKQYFRTRQKKFGDKKNDEDELQHSGRKKKVGATITARRGSATRLVMPSLSPGSFTTRGRGALHLDVFESIQNILATPIADPVETPEVADEDEEEFI